MVRWWLRAACAGMDPELFFPLSGGLPDEVAAVCDGCPVRAECLMDAARSEAWGFGVWGGTSQRQREKMRRPVVDGVTAALALRDQARAVTG